MVVSNDKWEREKQQKDFEFREEMILDSKVMMGRSILEDAPFNPWVKDYIRVDRCCLARSARVAPGVDPDSS